MASSTDRQIAAFLRLAARYWLQVFPRVSHARRHQRLRALAIPDPELRRVALESQGKWGNIEGAAAFAALVSGRHRAAAARAMICFQAAYNYLDLLGEQPSPDPAATGRRLHMALEVALEPDMPHPDYYEYLVGRPTDGGYLIGLLDTCRAALLELPSYALVATPARAAAERIVAFQSCNTGEVQGDLRALEHWGREHVPPGSDLCWWEAAASGGSSLGVYALMALAAQPGLSLAAVHAVADSYFPWIGALHSLLDNLVDTAEDRATGQHSLIGRYDSPEQAATRMGLLARRSLLAARELPEGSSYVLILGAMASFYLCTAQAQTPEALPVRRAVLEALGGSTRMPMLVFRVRAMK